MEAQGAWFFSRLHGNLRRSDVYGQVKKGAAVMVMFLKLLLSWHLAFLGKKYFLINEATKKQTLFVTIYSFAFFSHGRFHSHWANENVMTISAKGWLSWYTKLSSPNFSLTHPVASLKTWMEKKLDTLNMSNFCIFELFCCCSSFATFVSLSSAI